MKPLNLKEAIRARRLKRSQSLSHAFNSHFAVEILKSDRLRVSILLGVWPTACAVIVLLAITFSRDFQYAFHGKFDGFLLAILTGVALTTLYLLFERFAINRLIRTGKESVVALRYVSAFIETSIPTLGMFVAGKFLGPVYGLYTPATMVYGIFIVLSILRLDLRLCVFTGLVAGLEYIALAMWVISGVHSLQVEPILVGVPHHLFKGIILMGTGVIAGLVTVQIRKRILSSFESVEERNRISRTFGEYVSPAVVETLLDLKPDLRSENKKVCVMFLDIRNFTGFAEKRSPEEVVTYLESLFEFMIEIINRNNGIINKFLGDGFMAVFGAPLSDGNDCANAVRSAQEILARVKEEEERGTILPTTVGIGLHAGEAVTGSIGSALRKEYTVIGDVVNLAARIEKLNKGFGSQLLISEMVSRAVGNIAGAISKGTVAVRGREEGIEIYQLA
jgi:adenylate cyclase